MESKRRAGVLMHISSLPGKYGIGVMGQQAENFIDMLSEMSFRYWQVLPLNPTDPAGSPYCSYSAFAGNIALIDPEGLEKMGLVSHEDVTECEYEGSIFSADHSFAYDSRLSVLRKAFLSLDSELSQQLKLFAEQNPWVEPYAHFMALRDLYDEKPWWQWQENHARYEKALESKADYQKEIDFYIFTQYIFFLQWRRLKEYANSRNVFILGDMPIYVSRDSADVWSDITNFEINPDSLALTRVAGVPPDYFSQDGQLWGNPLYDWDKMKKDNYCWWTERLRCALKLYDKVRIDHFRAFASYWAVPAESETAKTGSWLKGPGMSLFNEIKKQLPHADIIAEDLGSFSEDVTELLKETEFPGMRVIQFGFDPMGDSTHLPHNYPKNSVAYVGTHDNNTILGWLWDALPQERDFALRYCCFGGNNWGDGGPYSGSCRAVTEAVWKSASDTAIVALQDMCGYGKDARMNIPGTAKGNWTFRISEEGLRSIDKNYYKEINHIYRRYY